MGINKKDIELVEKIKDSSLPIGYYAKLYGESERNIRYRIENANFYLKRVLNKEIYINNGETECNISSCDFYKFVESITVEEYVLSKEERENYILINYLFQEDTTINKIQEFCGVSRTTIKKDLKSLENYLSKFSLYFSMYKNKLIITGNEKKLRHLKLMKLKKYVTFNSNEIKIKEYRCFLEKIEAKIVKGYVEKFSSLKISTVIDNIEKKLKITFSQEFKNLMRLYMITTLERINRGYIIIKKNNSAFLNKLEEYSLIKYELSTIIAPKYEFEFLHLTEYFLSGFYNQSFSENILVVEGFISKVLEELEGKLNIKLLTNQNLGEKLLEYLVPAVYRIKNNFILNSELHWELLGRENISIVRDAVIHNVKYLEEPLREEEIYHITEILEKEIKYLNSKKISLKELILVVQKHTKECNINELAENILTRYESLIVDDRVILNDYGIIHYLRVENIYFSDKKLSFDEAINFGINNLYKNGYIKSNNICGITEFVQKFGQYMFIEKKVLFFYDKDKNNCNESSMAMIISKNGIEVDSGEIANILFVLFTKNKIEHLKLISELIYLLEREYFLDEILNSRTASEILNIVSGYLSIK